MRITNTTYRPQNYDYSNKANSSFAVYIGKDDRLKSFLLRVTIFKFRKFLSLLFLVHKSV